MALKVAVIIENFHGYDDTLECLTSLKKVNSAHKITVYVVDVEASGRNEELKKHPIHARVMEEKKNSGFSAAHNKGIAAAVDEGNEVFILLNNDTTVDSSFIDPLVKTALQTGSGLISPKIYFYPGREFHKDEYSDKERGKVIWYAGGVIDWDNIYAYHWGVNEVDHGQFDTLHESDFATGCCVAFSKETLEKVGYLDNSYFLYWEDTDWSVRAKRQELKIGFCPESIIFHKNAGSTGGSGSPLHVYYQTRNRLKFARKYGGIRLLAALMKEMRRKWKGVSKIERQAYLDGFFGRWGNRA